MPQVGATKPVILAVEDHEATRYLLARSLSASGYEVLEAATGAEALLHASRAHAIVLDVHLPDLHGFDVCSRLKNDPATAHIPIIFLTATARDPESVRTGKSMGASAYLCSPNDYETLISVIQHNLGAL